MRRICFRSPSRFRYESVLVIGLVALAIGCSNGDRPDIGNVSGVVTLDGKPMHDAMVQFKASGFRLSQGFTDSEGRYELVYLRDIKGAAVGKHSVFIDRVTGFETTPKHLRLPARYNDKSTLEANVQPGENELNFDLTSDK